MQYPFYQQQQNNGFVMVRNEMEARNYPVGFGNSVTFKDESAPFVYTKTMGYSQMQPPIFEKYRLVKEEATETPQEAKSSDFDGLKCEIDRLWAEVEALKSRKKKKELDDESA